MADLLNQLKKMKRKREMLASLSLAKRNQILNTLAQSLSKNKKKLLSANKKDLKELKRKGMRDRLELNGKRIRGMARGLLDIAKQPEVLNRILEVRKPKNGLVIKKVSVPLGTVGVIYESRPNVSVDLSGFAIKTGNALVLKGGSDAYHTNRALVQIIGQVLKRHGLPPNLIYLIKPDDDWKKILLRAFELVDVIVPRGGQDLIKWVRESSKVPIIETGAGVCHTFVDEPNNIRQAVKIMINAKTKRPSVCNALDTLVIKKAMLEPVWKEAAKPFARAGVEVYADAPALPVLKKYYPSSLLRASKLSDYGKEFLSLKMAIKTVNSFEEGLKFVKEKTSGHSEAILTDNKQHARTFLKKVDAAAVFHNASTYFSDGGEFGMGGEVGISTQKLHARGPMGLEALTSYKWVVLGKGQIRK